MVESKELSLRDLQEAALEAHAVIRDEVVHLFERYGGVPSEITPTLKRLFAYLSSRNQAVSFLLSWGYAWDAEIVLRSFYETSAKILFICFAKDEEKPVLVDEFWNKLGAINDRRRARKAEFSVGVGDDIPSLILKAFQDERVFDLNPKGNKAERKRLEQKWSFSEIIESLDGHMIDGKPLLGMKSILHDYGMCSHLAHADCTALDLMTDRALRKPDELKLLEISHASRILSDQVSLTWFCAEALRHHFKGKFANEQKFYEAFRKTGSLCEILQSAFYESQKDFYDDIAERP